MLRAAHRRPLTVLALGMLGCTTSEAPTAAPPSAPHPTTASPPTEVARDHSDLVLPPVAAPAHVADARRLLLEEYTLTDSPLCGGAKLYGRGAFLPYADPRGMSETDFFARLSSAFGPPSERGDARGYCLTHRASGIEIEAYVGESGPSYGGRPETQEAIDARVAADPILRGGHPVDWSLHEHDSDAERERLSILMHAWYRRMSDAVASPAEREAITRLDQLLNSIDG